MTKGGASIIDRGAPFFIAEGEGEFGLRLEDAGNRTQAGFRAIA